MKEQSRKFYWVWGVMFLLVFTPNLFMFFHQEINLKSILYLLLGASFCLFPALFLRAKIYFGIYFLFILSAPLEIGHIIINKIPLTSGFLLTLLSTNLNEAANYLSSMKIMIPASVIFWVLYVYLWIKIPNYRILDTRKKKIGIYIYAVLFAGISILPIIVLIQRPQKPNLRTIVRAIPYSFEQKLYKTYPYSFGIKIYHAISERLILNHQYKKTEKFKFNPLKKNNNECEIYIFVMGESARYDNFGINGYSRNTTPFLDSLKKEGKLLTFSNVYASSNLTCIVHPIILTRATVLERSISNEEKSIVSLFKEAGFKTYLLSNQGENEIFSRQLALEADYNYINNYDYNFDEKYDGLLLPQIDSILNEKEKKKCLFLFTIGNHYIYRLRYPAGFEQFKPVNPKSSFSFEPMRNNRELFVNAYDNAIRYTDYFIHEIIKRVERKNCESVLFYISDHGENIYDTPEINLGHGTLQPTEQELHIPMFIWFSDNYLQLNDSIYITLSNNSAKKINSGNVFYTFANIAGIKYDLYQKEKDFSSKAFIPDSIHWVLNPDLEILQKHY